MGYCQIVACGCGVAVDFRIIGWELYRIRRMLAIETRIAVQPIRRCYKTGSGITAPRELLFGDCDREYQIAWTYVVYDFQTLSHATEACVHSVQMLRVATVVANEEL